MPALAARIVSQFSELDDVTLTSAARGDVLYHNATEWVNLAPGTDGEVLTTHGAGADPTWEAISAADLSTAVILAPTTDARNVIVPTADTVRALAVQRFSGTHSENLFEALDETGLAVLSISPLGRLFIKADSNDQARIILGAADSSHVGVTSVGGELHVYNGIFATFATMRIGSLMANGTLQAVGISSQIGINRRADDAPAWALYSQSGEFNLFDSNGAVTRWGLVSGSGLLTHTVTDAATNTVTVGHTFGHNTSGTPAAGFGHELRFQLESSTTPDQAATALSAEWATATDASRKARGKLIAYDTLARECFRFEADGSAAMVGFLGAGAQGVQTVNAASTDLATVVALTNQIRAALIGFGLLV